MSVTVTTQFALCAQQLAPVCVVPLSAALIYLVQQAPSFADVVVWAAMAISFVTVCGVVMVGSRLVRNVPWAHHIPWWHWFTHWECFHEMFLARLIRCKACGAIKLFNERRFVVLSTEEEVDTFRKACARLPIGKFVANIINGHGHDARFFEPAQRHLWTTIGNWVLMPSPNHREGACNYIAWWVHPDLQTHSPWFNGKATTSRCESPEYDPNYAFLGFSDIQKPEGFKSTFLDFTADDVADLQELLVEGRAFLSALLSVESSDIWTTMHCQPRPTHQTVHVHFRQLENHKVVEDTLTVHFLQPGYCLLVEHTIEVLERHGTLLPHVLPITLYIEECRKGDTGLLPAEVPREAHPINAVVVREVAGNLF